MKDAIIKRLIAEAVDKRDLIYDVLGSQGTEDIYNGNFYIDENLINQSLRNVILNALYPYLRDYHVSFIDDHILISVEADIRQLGLLSLGYKMKMKEFYFGSKGHSFSLDYKEDVRSKGNMMQATIFKLFSAKQPLIEMAAHHLNNEGLRITGDRILVDLDRIPQMQGIPKDLVIRWQGCEAGRLLLNFEFVTVVE
ncbi:MAG: hypothetical protein ACOX4U_00890 [Anaerovoracaceae bacterium]|jgi:hypothetical protein